MINTLFGDLLKEINENLEASGLQVELRILGIDNDVRPKGNILAISRIIGRMEINDPMFAERHLLDMLYQLRNATRKEADNNANGVGNSSSC